MSDGRLLFDTKLDTSGLKDGLSKVKKEVDSNIGGIGDGFQKTGAKLTNFITKPALAAGTALGGLVIGKGLSRLTNIDNAKAKLEGLGHSADSVEKIMKNATESVKGTAFGLDAAATTAASAVAAGIKPGQDLTRYLKLTADAASIAGIDMSEMGSVFNKVAASGKLMAGELDMLQDRGIPMLSLLAKSSGKTMEQVKDDMSKGKISTEDFLNAIEEGMGGAALTMGSKTLSAALDNMWAAIGRVGANFLSAGDSGKGVFDQLRDIVVDLTDKIGVAEEKAKGLGETFGIAFGKTIDVLGKMPKGLIAGIFGAAISAGPILKFTGSVLKGVEALNTFRAAEAGTSLVTGVLTGKISAGQVVMGKFGKGMSSVASNSSKLASTLGGKLSSAYTGVTAKIAAMGKTQSTVNTLYGTNYRNLYNQESGMKAAAKGLGTYSKNLITNAAAHVKNVASTVADTVANTGFGKAIGSIAGKVGTAAKAVLSFASAHRVAMLASLGAVGAIVGLAVYMNKTGTSADELADKITGFADKAANAITGFADALPGIIDSLMANLEANIGSIEQILNMLIPALTNAAVSVIQSITEVLPTIIESLANVIGQSLPTVIGAMIMLLMGLVDAFTQVIGPIVDAMPVLIDAIVNALITLAPAIIDAGVTLFSALVDALPQIISALAGALPGIIEQICGFITDMTPVLLSAGVTLFMALVEAIPKIVVALISAIPQILTAVLQGISMLKQTLSSALMTMLSGIWTNIKDTASKAWQGITDSISSKFRTLVSNAKGIVDKVKTTLSSAWDSIKSKASSLWTKIKTTITKPLESAKKTAQSIVNSIKSHLSFSGLVGKVRGLFNSVKNAITSPIEKAKSTISGIVNKIKGFFNFNVKKPNIPLPHFSIKPAGWKIGDLLKGKIPSLGIKWYAKGGIFDQPTIAGIGEAGAEAVIPLNKFWRKMDMLAESIMTGMEYVGNKIQTVTTPPVAAIKETVAQVYPIPSVQEVRSSRQIDDVVSAIGEGNHGDVYEIGDITLDASNLEDVKTVKELVEIIRRAKALA